MSTEENKKIYLRLIERQNQFDPNDIEGFFDQFYKEFYATGYMMHFPGSEWNELDWLALKKVTIEWFREHLNTQVTVDNIFAEGDMVATRGYSTSTKAATGEPEKWFFIALARIVEGMVAEEWQLVAQVPVEAHVQP